MPIVGSGRVESGQVVFPTATTPLTTATSAAASSASQTQGVLSVGGNTVGAGAGLFAGSTGTQHVVLNIKSVIGGTGIQVIQDQDDITLIATGAVQTFVTFASLNDGPGPIIPNAVLIGAANASTLAWTPFATTANTVLTYSGSGFVWQAPAAAGVTSVAATGDAAIHVTGGPITGNGTLAFSLSNTTVAAGSYVLTSLVIDSHGRITNAVSGVAIAALTSITGDTAIHANVTNGAVTLSLGLSGVVAGSYTAPSVTVDNQGRISAIANGTVAVLNAALTGDVIGSGPLGNIATHLNATGVTAGSYEKVVVDATGRVFSGALLTAADLVAKLGYTPISNAARAVANGVATLDSSGRIPSNELPASITGAVVYRGTWDASLNQPVLTSGGGSTNFKGDYYKVAIAGSVDLDDHNQWNVDDTVIFNGDVWDLIPGQNSTVVSVAGRVGVVLLDVIDISNAAPLFAPAFSGNATSTTPATADSSISIATTAFVKNQNFVTAATLAASNFATTAFVISQGYLANTTLGVAGGIATLDGTGKVPLGQLPPVTPNGLITSLANTVIAGSFVAGSVNVDLAPVANVAGVYTTPNLTVDAYGRVTHAVSGSVGNTGGIQSFTVSGSAAISVANGTVSSTGSIVGLSLSPSGVAAGTYAAATLVVGVDGRISNASAGTPGGVQSITVSSGGGLTVVNPTITNSGTVIITLAATAVAAGTYVTPTLVIGADGRITNAITTNAISFSTVATTAPDSAPVYAGMAGSVVVLNPIVGSARVVVSSGGSPAGIVLDLATGVVAPGTFTSVTVDTYGRVVAGSNASTAISNTIAGLLTARSLYTFVGTGSQTVFALANATGGTNDAIVSVAGVLLEPGIGYTISNATLTLANAAGSGTPLWVVGLGSTAAGNATSGTTSLSLSGDVIGSGSGNIPTVLANSGVTAGTYSFATVTVDAKGRVTAIVAGTAASGSGPKVYQLTVTFDSSGNITATSPFSNLPVGWSAVRDTATQMTVTHNLGKFPQNVTALAYNTTLLGWYMKEPSGSTQFSVGMLGSGTTPNTFTVFGMTSSFTSGSISSPAILSVLI